MSYHDLHGDVRELYDLYGQSEGRIGDLEEDVTSLKRENLRLRKNIKVLKKERDALVKKADTAKQETSVLRRRVRVLEAEVQKLREKNGVSSESSESSESSDDDATNHKAWGYCCKMCNPDPSPSETWSDSD